MKKFEIWSEGYAATCEHSEARYHGSAEGKSFKEAVKNFADTHNHFKKYFNKETMSFWGCKLFDNETKARQNFG
jgi:hypothetical protein